MVTTNIGRFNLKRSFYLKKIILTDFVFSACVILGHLHYLLRHPASLSNHLVIGGYISWQKMIFKALSHGEIFLATCNAILLLRDAN